MFDEQSIARILGKVDPEILFDPVQSIAGKAVLVTGAGGFIGSRLCMQLASFEPSMLLLVDNAESNLYEIHREIREKYPNQNVIPLLASYGDLQQMHRALLRFEVQIVFHVAAYKHVPLVERNPVMAIANNVTAAEDLFTACQSVGISDLIVVSSDKAVNPTNVMGATKRLVECLALLCSPRMNVRIVRFGNVMWSTGSVLPLFYEQLTQRKELTITSLDADRYFMTVQQAVGLILQSMFLGRGVFCFDMGEPVKIIDVGVRLAKEVLGSDDGVRVRVIGLRPGEKLHEELTLGEKLTQTDHPQIMQAHESIPSYSQLMTDLDRLGSMCEAYDIAGVRAVLKGIIPGYVPMCGIVDDLWLKRMSEDMKELDDCYKTPSPVST